MTYVRPLEPGIMVINYAACSVGHYVTRPYFTTFFVYSLNEYIMGIFCWQKNIVNHGYNTAGHYKHT